MNQIVEKILLIGTAIGLLGGGALFISSICFTDTICAFFGTLDMLYVIAVVFASVGIVCAIILGINALIVRHKKENSE